MNPSRVLVWSLMLVVLNCGIALAGEPGPVAIGTRFVFLSPSARFDNQLSSGGSEFDDDFKPDIFFQWYPAQALAVEYSILVTEHDFRFGLPLQEAGTTWLATQTVSARLYLAPDSTFSPYFGGGINIMTPFNTQSFSGTFTIDSHTGWTAQTGFDLRTSQHTWFNFDYRYLDMDTRARSNGTSYRFDLSPHVFAFGVKYRH